MKGYSVRQLLRYHAHCKANPSRRVLPPGGRAGWDDMSAAEWSRWFMECLMLKCSRGTDAAKIVVGNGNNWKRRHRELADAKAECRWCGSTTGSVNRRFCDMSCARAFC